MSASPQQYEFSQDQNALIGSLASKMRFVGLFFVVIGVLNFIMAVLVLVAIFRDRVPRSWVDQLPAEAKEQVEKQKGNLPRNENLWGVAVNNAVVGLFFVLIGAWTRTAGGGFQNIVDTAGRDISHLMNALSSLHSMYALIYMLLVVAILIGLVSLVMVLYKSFTGG